MDSEVAKQAVSAAPATTFETEKKKELIHEAPDDGLTFAQRKAVQGIMGSEDVMEISKLQEHFLILDSQLRAGAYEKKGMFKWKRKPSAEMQAIFDLIDDFRRFGEDIIDKESFGSDVVRGVELHNNIITYCDMYISNHQPKSKEGQVRLDYVKKIKESVESELKVFEDAAAYYKDSIRTDGKKWIEVISQIRTRRFEHGKNGVTVTMGGGATSSVYILSDGSKKLFFKESEPIPKNGGLGILDVISSKYFDKDPGNGTSLSQDIAVGVIDYKRHITTLQEYVTDSDVGTIMMKAGMYTRQGQVLTADTVKDIFAGNAGMTAYIEKITSNQQSYQRFLEIISEMGRLVRLSENADIAKLERGSDTAGRTSDFRSLTVKNVVTSRLADALGIGDIIAESTLATVEVDGKKLTGVAMEQAPGTDLISSLDKTKNKGKTAHYSPEAMRQLANLQLFDVLCGQVDRNLGNYFCVTEAGEKDVVVKSIMGIDNDLSFGLISYKEIVESGKGTFMVMVSPQRRDLKTNETRITIPHIDEEFSERLLSMTPEYLNMLTMDLLSDKEREFLCDRLLGLQEMIRQAHQEETESKGKRRIFLREDSEWGDAVTALEQADYDAQRSVMGNSYLDLGVMGKKIDPNAR